MGRAVEAGRPAGGRGRGRVEFTVRHRDLDEPVRPDTMYWVRAFQEDGTAAWSSPIWVAILPEHPATRGFLYWQPDEPACLEVDVVRRTGRQAELLLSSATRIWTGRCSRADAGDRGRFGRTIARERLESLPHSTTGRYVRWWMV
jgi:hypothetical protein